MLPHFQVLCPVDMYLLTMFVAFAAGVAQSNIPLVSRDLNPYITSQRARSLQGIFDNIGPDGVKAPDASSGIIVASPSTVNPDC